MSLGDIYFTIFRHKWKILIISSLAVLGAAGLYFFSPVPYQSEAKLCIRYVVETKPPDQVGAEQNITSPDRRGESIIATEAEILSSSDIPFQTAQQLVGMTVSEKLVPSFKGDTNELVSKVAAVIASGLKVEPPRKGNVIRVSFAHRDPEVVRPVLSQIIDAYFKRHVMVHRSLGAFNDFLNKRTDELRVELNNTENELRRAKTNAGIISLEDTKKLYSEEVSKIKLEILNSEAELAERQAMAAELGKVAAAGRAADTNSANSSNPPPALASSPVPPEKTEEYRRISSLVETLTKREQELLLQFTAESSLVKNIREQVASNQKAKRQLEQDFPGLLLVKVSESRTAVDDLTPAQKAEAILLTERTRIVALQAKLNKLNEQLNNVQERAVKVYDAEGTITDLTRRRELGEAQYKSYSASLERAVLDEALGAARNANISMVQTPSPPFRETQGLIKKIAIILFGGLAAAFGLAFVIDMFLDSSLKRPVDVQNRLRLPLFISVPYKNGDGGGAPNAVKRLPWKGEADDSDVGAKTKDGASAASTLFPAPVANAEVPPWAHGHKLRPFWDALRDRLITWFELKEMTHKPKLVAVTGCGEGSGVSTISAGLAAALSETGEGNVLLVDMNQQNGVLHQFFQGSLTCGLDEAFIADKRDEAMVQDNLFVVTEHTTDHKLLTVLPRRFKSLVPRMRASDYDYIIFDMPPVSQVSMTPRLAKFMDIVLVVVEAEKSDRDVVKAATTMLTDVKANVGIVLNKTKSYVPKSLQQEL
jgi:uncharacterized protein involved in exopolysaccharide biosynthesis/Mrp family chromosome partitioning ATPase